MDVTVGNIVFLAFAGVAADEPHHRSLVRRGAGLGEVGDLRALTERRVRRDEEGLHLAYVPAPDPVEVSRLQVESVLATTAARRSAAPAARSAAESLPLQRAAGTAQVNASNANGTTMSRSMLTLRGCVRRRRTRAA